MPLRPSVLAISIMALTGLAGLGQALAADPASGAQSGGVMPFGYQPGKPVVPDGTTLPADQAPAATIPAGPGAAKPGSDKADPTKTGTRAERRAAARRQPVLFSADEVTYDDDLGLVVARGHVELTQSGRTVLADTVAYNQHSDTVTATGHVALLDENGETLFADFIELTDNMREAFIKDVRGLLADQSRVAGNTARRTGGNRLEIRKGVYSPCDACKDDPSQPPLWQLRAETLIHDRDQHLIEYENVTLDIAGVPVLYSPYLSSPDPSVKRYSGLLAPTILRSNTLGVAAITPYFWAIAPDKDFTFSPIFTTEEGVVAAGDYRQRFANGTLEIQASLTDSNNSSADPSNPSYYHSELRGHIFGNGEFDLDDQFRTGFAVNRVSDQTYLSVYHFGGIQNFLQSRAYVEDFDGRDYGALNTYDFQSLREGVSDRSQAIVLPSLQYQWAGRPQPWGGVFTTNVGLLDIVRETGPAERRITAGTEMDLPMILPGGQKLNLVAGLRADGYDYSAQALSSTGPLTAGETARAYPQVGLEWAYPWVRHDPASTTILEPRAAVYAAPVGLNPSRIPDGDSASFDYADTDLFVRNRLYGYDQVDSGQRVDLAMAANYYGEDEQSLAFLLGQSYRFQNTSPFGPGTGLNRPESDYVGRLVASTDKRLDLYYRFRFDERDLKPNRQEVGVNFGPPDTRVNLTLIQIADNPSTGETHRTEVGGGINYKIDDYWSTSAHTTKSLAGDNNLFSAGVAAQYTDECVSFVSSLTQNGIRNRDITPGVTLLFQVVFKNLGEINAPVVQNASSSL